MYTGIITHYINSCQILQYQKLFYFILFLNYFYFFKKFTFWAYLTKNVFLIYQRKSTLYFLRGSETAPCVTMLSVQAQGWGGMPSTHTPACDCAHL